MCDPISDSLRNLLDRALAGEKSSCAKLSALLTWGLMLRPMPSPSQHRVRHWNKPPLYVPVDTRLNSIYLLFCHESEGAKQCAVQICNTWQATIRHCQEMVEKPVSYSSFYTKFNIINNLWIQICIFQHKSVLWVVAVNDFECTAVSKKDISSWQSRTKLLSYSSKVPPWWQECPGCPSFRQCMLGGV